MPGHAQRGRWTKPQQHKEPLAGRPDERGDIERHAKPEARERARRQAREEEDVRQGHKVRSRPLDSARQVEVWDKILS